MGIKGCVRFFVLLKARIFILVNQWKPALDISQQKWGHFGEGRHWFIHPAYFTCTFSVPRGDLFPVQVLSLGLSTHSKSMGIPLAVSSRKNTLFSQLNLKGSLKTLTNFHGKQLYVGVELNLGVIFCSCSAAS